jgi:hypothetical protein
MDAVVVGDIGNLRGQERIPQRFERFAHTAEAGRRRRDFGYLRVAVDVEHAVEQRVLQQFVLVDPVGVDDQDALLLKQKGNAPGLAEVSAAFVKVMAQVSGRPVAVVGQRRNHDGHAARPVAFIGDLIVMMLVSLASDFLMIRSILSLGTLLALAFAIISRSLLFVAGSPPPSRTATAISRPILVKMFARLESVASFCV